MTILNEKIRKQMMAHKNEVKLISLADNDAYTGQEMLAIISNLEEKFKARHIKKNDVILIAMGNHWLYPLIELALWRLGAIVHPIAPTSGFVEILDEFQTYHYTAGIFDENFQEKLTATKKFTDASFLLDGAAIKFYRYDSVNQRAQAQLVDKNLTMILNTSGSTGKPKRVGLTADQLYQSASHIIDSQGLMATDTAMVVMPMFHVNAQVIQMLGTLLSGGKLVVAPKFSASGFWPAIAKYGVTWVSIVPTIIQILQINNKAQQGFTSVQEKIKLKYVRSASFSLSVEQLHHFESRYHIPVIEGYGMTEAASLIALNPFNAPKSGTVGLPVATNIAILVDGAISQKAGQVGEILLRGDHVITDYLDSRPDSFYQGWLRTGDLGQFDDDGYLKIVGRIKDIISHGGEKVAPVAIEDSLRQLSFIEDVVIIGLPDALYGEEVVAVIIPRAQRQLTEGAMTNQLLQYAANHLSLPARPTRVFFVNQYPHNPTGKVMRQTLVTQLSR